MRYAAIRKLDISNGEEIGVSMFVQGCPIHCKNCFNPETWDFNGGSELTDDVINKFIDLANREQIRRISFLGGEPLCVENVQYVLHMIELIKQKYGSKKKIWVYTGYQYESLIDRDSPIIQKIMSKIDVLVDGQYKDELRDMSLQFRGSSNQRLIDMKKTVESGEVVLYATKNR